MTKNESPTKGCILQLQLFKIKAQILCAVKYNIFIHFLISSNKSKSMYTVLNMYRVTHR